jgi:antitoxin HigA-1
MNTLRNIHPGEVLTEEFLIPFNITPARLAKDIALAEKEVVAITQCSSSITADTALRLSKYFGNSAKFWLGLQDDFDLEETFRAKERLLNSIQPIDLDAV